MNLLTYSNTVEIKIHQNPDVYMEALMKKMQGKLRNLKISSQITNDALVFEKPVQMFQYDRSILFKPIKKGQIRIKKINSRTIEICWEVELKTVLVSSITIGLFLGFFMGLYALSSGLMMITSLLTGLLFSTINYLFGLNFIQTTMDEVLETSV